MAEPAWLGPDNSWPSHLDLDEVLIEARKQRWWLRPSSNGCLWGRITCAEPAGNARPDKAGCLILIRTREEAGHVRRSLGTCPHGA
jgi:hypothetical protein